jgi:RNA polymerase sigma-32 factor
VTSNLRLVVKIALQFQETWMHNFLDLIQEGNLGLMQAVHKFDPLRGVKFSYYAVYWIKAYMLRFIMEHWRLVKIGTTQRQRKLFFRLNKERQRLQAEGFDPKPKLLADRIGVSEQDITDMDQRLNKPEISLDASIKEGSNEARMGFVPGTGQSVDAQVARKERKVIIRKKLVGFRKICNEQELDILENRLLAELPLTLRQIGEHYGISRERVRQIQNKMLTKLKNYFEREIPGFASLSFGLA